MRDMKNGSDYLQEEINYLQGENLNVKGRYIKTVVTKGGGGRYDFGPRPQGSKWVVVVTTVVAIAIIAGLLALCYPEVAANFF